MLNEKYNAEINYDSFNIVMTAKSSIANSTNKPEEIWFVGTVYEPNHWEDKVNY